MLNETPALPLVEADRVDNARPAKRPRAKPGTVSKKIKPPTPRGNPDDPAFDQALLDIVDGRPGTYRHLEVISGLTINALKSRIQRGRSQDDPGEHEGETPELTDEETRYVEKRTHKSGDAEIVAFIGEGRLHARSRPDWNRSKPPTKPKTPSTPKSKRQRHGLTKGLSGA